MRRIYRAANQRKIVQVSEGFAVPYWHRSLASPRAVKQHQDAFGRGESFGNSQARTTVPP